MLQKGRVWWLLVCDKLQRRAQFLQLFFVTLGVTYFIFTLDVAIPIPVVTNKPHTRLQEWLKGNVTADSNNSILSHMALYFTERFRFTQDISKFRLGGPAVNPVPGGVKFRHQPREGVICNTTGPFILATVPSSLGNLKRRNTIRRTWAHPKLYPYTGLRAVFVVGETMDPLVQKSLDEEAERYGDLLQYNYIDSYRNLSYKTSSLLTWAATRCPKFTFLAKVDDDVLVNPFNLVTFLRHQLIKLLPVPPYQALEHPRAEGVRLFNHTTNATQVIYGRVENFHKPLRKGRWGLTETEYPEALYPTFVLGGTYIVGHRGVRRLFKYLPYTPMVCLEDVYMMGLVAHAAGVPRLPASKTPDRFSMVETSELSRNLGWARIINKHRDKDNKPLLTVPPDLRL